MEIMKKSLDKIIKKLKKLVRTEHKPMTKAEGFIAITYYFSTGNIKEI